MDGWTLGKIKPINRRKFPELNVGGGQSGGWFDEKINGKETEKLRCTCKQIF